MRSPRPLVLAKRPMVRPLSDQFVVVLGGAESPGLLDLRTPRRPQGRVVSRRDPVSHQCRKTRSDALDEATQTRHAKRPDHYLCCLESRFWQVFGRGLVKVSLFGGAVVECLVGPDGVVDDAESVDFHVECVSVADVAAEEVLVFQ